jgi:hypothetical protein
MLETLTTHKELLDNWDAIARGLNYAIKKIGVQGQTAEHIMKQMCGFVETPYGFILVSKDEGEKIEGLLFAIAWTDGFPTPWIEVPILWAEPGAGKRELYRAFDMLMVWAKGLGGTDIWIAVMRSPEALMKHFYAKLGFEPAGIIARRRL